MLEFAYMFSVKKQKGTLACLNFIFLKSSHYCDQNLKKIPGQMISFFVSISNTWFDVFPKVFLEV